MRFKSRNENGVQFGNVPRDRKPAGTVECAKPLETHRSLSTSVANWFHRNIVTEYDARIEVGRNARARSRNLEDVSEVEIRYGGPSFTVDAGSFSSFSVGRSTGLSSNVKRIYREVGQLPSRGTGFLTLPSMGNLKVNWQPWSLRGVERGVGKVHRRKEEISTRNFGYELDRGT